MGLLDFLLPMTAIAAAEQLRDAATMLDMSDTEKQIAAALGVETHIFLKERILFRVAFSETSVNFYYREDSHPRVREMGEHLERLNSAYIFSMPGVPQEIAGQLYARARDDYLMRPPHELAGLMLTSMYPYQNRDVAPQDLLAFGNLVHKYARNTMIQTRDLAKKLTEYKR